MARRYNQDDSDLTFADFQAAIAPPTASPGYGSAGINYLPVETAREGRMGYNTDPEQDYVTLNGVKYRRAGNFDLPNLQAVFGNQATFDPTHGNLVPADVFDKFMEAQGRDPATKLLPMLVGGLTGAGIMSGLGAFGGGVGADSLIGGAGADVLGADSFLGSMDLMGGVGTPLGDAAAASAALATGAAAPVVEMGTRAGLLDTLRLNAGIPPGSGSALSRILSGNGNASDWMSTLGTLGATGLGVLGANAQQDAFKDVSNQYLALGAPYREKLAATYQPGFDLTQADPAFGKGLQASADAMARAVSVGGNPAGNPGALAQIQEGVLNRYIAPYTANYRGQLGQFGGLGLNTSGQAALSGAGQSGDLYNALGFGLGQLTTPQNDIESLLRRLSNWNTAGNNFRMNTGGPI